MTPLKRARKLLRGRYRRETGLFLAEGPHVVQEALLAGARLETLFVATGARNDPDVLRVCVMADDRDVPVQEISPEALASVAETRTPQGLVAVAPLPEPTAEPFARPGLWLLLDAVQDPGNVGTLLRAADAFGARGVIAAKGTAGLWSGKVVRSAQGAHFRLELLAELAGGPSAMDVVAGLRAAGGELWAADVHGEDIYGTPTRPPTCVVALGNEARGLSEDLLGAADRRVRVPQPGRAESLNVAMAGSVVLSWLVRGSG